MSIALTTTTSVRIGAGTYVRPHTAVIHRLWLVGTSSAQRAWAAYSAAMGSLHRPHDNHVPSPGCVLDLATYFLNPTAIWTLMQRPQYSLPVPQGSGLLHVGASPSCAYRGAATNPSGVGPAIRRPGPNVAVVVAGGVVASTSTITTCPSMPRTSASPSEWPDPRRTRGGSGQIVNRG